MKGCGSHHTLSQKGTIFIGPALKSRGGTLKKSMRVIV
jgi:hypothetical protein